MAAFLWPAQLPAPASAEMNPDLFTAYTVDPTARAVSGGSTAGADAPRLEPGTYVDTISAGERKFYRVALDDRSNAYVSAVLAPPPGIKVAAGEGIKVTLKSSDGAKCSVSNAITFGGGTALPSADYSTRRIGAGRKCQDAGDYYYSVEWLGGPGGSRADGWPVELKYMAEPGLKPGAPAPAAVPPADWHHHLPGHVKGAARRARGGTGFNDAAKVGYGVWNDTLRPGESRFYRVPVDWGQQLFVDADFPAVPAAKSRGATGSVRLSLFNTARGFVDNAANDYRGTATRVSLGSVPVAFVNRLSKLDATSAMRFSGWYYIRLTADRAVREPLPLTLRVGVEGEPQSGPLYDGDALGAGFGATPEEFAAARQAGETGAVLMRAVGYAGVGLGSALLLFLGGWTALARRGGRGRRRRGRHASPSPL
ncbi:hypothetical protein [Streptomyces sp. CAU 1734]|uniref:hypothetical protein n=1 Tax=Streptomyces sp. CAU 1734 TaxID=3140360 RepID=UPI00326067DA